MLLGLRFNLHLSLNRTIWTDQSCGLKTCLYNILQHWRESR